VAKPFVPQSEVTSQPLWSQLDEYLWHTCDILTDILEGRVAHRPTVATTAPLGHGDRALAVGPGQRLTWRALGDGSYVHNSVAAFGSPGLVFGTLAANAIGNAARRGRAASDARPRWVLEDAGHVTLTLRKLHFAGRSGALDFGWTALASIDLAASDVFQTSYVSTRGVHTTVRVRTPWASLAFALAAITAFPAHPRLLAGGWLPPDFERRCARAGRPYRPAARLALRKGRS
jgi:hypothetical protein